jgi:hypothetical protein
MRQQLPTIAAGLLAAFLILSPALAGAATAYTLTVGTSALQYSDAFGSSSSWVSGTYTVTATWGNSASATPITATSTFTYTTHSTITPTSGSGLTVTASANTLVYAGQTVQIFALAYWNSNGSAAGKATWTASVIGPSGTAPSISWTVSSPARGIAEWTGPLPAGIADGTYAVELSATESGVTAWTQTAFTVNSWVANTNQLTAFGTQLTALGTQLTALQSATAGISSNVATLVNGWKSLSSSLASFNSNSSFTTLSQQIQSNTNAVTGLQTTLNSIQASIVSINTHIAAIQSGMNGVTSAVAGLQTVTPTVSTLNTSVGNSQTYILVVAALAVITLVLELAILIRKMS